MTIESLVCSLQYSEEELMANSASFEGSRTAVTRPSGLYVKLVQGYTLEQELTITLYPALSEGYR